MLAFAFFTYRQQLVLDASAAQCPAAGYQPIDGQQLRAAAGLCQGDARIQPGEYQCDAQIIFLRLPPQTG